MKKIAFTIDNNEEILVDFDKTSQLLVYQLSEDSKIQREIITIDNTRCKSRIAILLADYNIDVIYTMQIGFGAEQACIAYGSEVVKYENANNISFILEQIINKKP